MSHPQYPHFPHLEHSLDHGHPHHHPSHHDRHPSHALAERIAPVLPDLRFEPSYLKSIARYIRVSDEYAEIDEKSEGGKGMVVREVRDVKVQVHWPSVLWVTLRDQVVSPFVQGAVWGYASLFISPILAGLRFKSRFSSIRPNLKKTEEGKAAGWLRNMFKATLGGMGMGTAGVGTGAR